MQAICCPLWVLGSWFNLNNIFTDIFQKLPINTWPNLSLSGENIWVKCIEVFDSSMVQIPSYQVIFSTDISLTSFHSVAFPSLKNLASVRFFFQNWDMNSINWTISYNILELMDFMIHFSPNFRGLCMNSKHLYTSHWLLIDSVIHSHNGHTLQDCQSSIGVIMRLLIFSKGYTFE